MLRLFIINDCWKDQFWLPEGKIIGNIIWRFLISGFAVVMFRGLVVRFRGQLNFRPNTSFSDYVSNMKNDQRQISFPTVYNTSHFATKIFWDKRGRGFNLTPRQWNIVDVLNIFTVNFSYNISIIRILRFFKWSYLSDENML